MGQAGHGTEGLSTARDSEFSAKTNHPRVANPPRKAPRKMRQTLSAPARLPVSTTPQPPPTIHTVFSTSRQVSHSLSSNNFKKKKKKKSRFRKTHPRILLTELEAIPPHVALRLLHNCQQRRNRCLFLNQTAASSSPSKGPTWARVCQAKADITI